MYLKEFFIYPAILFDLANDGDLGKTFLVSQ